MMPVDRGDIREQITLAAARERSGERTSLPQTPAAPPAGSDDGPGLTGVDRARPVKRLRPLPARWPLYVDAVLIAFALIGIAAVAWPHIFP